MNKQINKAKEELNKKLEELITEFNKKWMHKAYIPCEKPFVNNEYPLTVQLKSVNEK